MGIFHCYVGLPDGKSIYIYHHFPDTKVPALPLGCPSPQRCTTPRVVPTAPAPVPVTMATVPAHMQVDGLMVGKHKRFNNIQQLENLLSLALVGVFLGGLVLVLGFQASDYVGCSPSIKLKVVLLQIGHHSVFNLICL